MGAVIAIGFAVAFGLGYIFGAYIGYLEASYSEDWWI